MWEVEDGHNNPPAISLNFFDLASPFASLEELLPGDGAKVRVSKPRPQQLFTSNKNKKWTG